MSGRKAPLASIGELGLALLRWSWLILASAIAGVALATYLAPDASTHSATAVVGLTDEVRWPFFNSTRQRIGGLADGIDPRDVVSNSDGLISVEVTLPANEAFLNVKAVASDADLAVRAANEFATMLVEVDATNGPTVDAVQAALEFTAVEINQLNAAIATTDIAYADLVAQQAAAEARWLEVRIIDVGIEVRNEAAAAKNAIDLQVAQISQERDTLGRRLTGLEVERDQLEVRLITEAVGPETEMVRSAVAEAVPAAPLRPRQFVGGLTGAVLAGLAVWIISENFGRLRTAAGVHAVAGVPVIDARLNRGFGRLAVWLNRLDSSAAVGFVGGGVLTEQALYELQQVSSSYPTTVVRVWETTMPAATDRRLIDLGGPEQGQWFDRSLSACDEVVLLVPHNHYRPAALRKIVDEIMAVGSEVSMAVVIPKSKANRISASEAGELAGA